MSRSKLASTLLPFWTRALARCFFAVSKPQKPVFAVWRKKKKKTENLGAEKKKKNVGVFGHCWDPLARPTDDWHASTLIFFCSLRSRKYTPKKIPLASLAELTHIFFCLRRHCLFCFAKKGLLSDSGVKPASLHRTLTFFCLRRYFLFYNVFGNPGPLAIWTVAFCNRKCNRFR